MNPLIDVGNVNNYQGLIDLIGKNATNQHILGFMYLEGIHFPRDYQKARQYFSNETNPSHTTVYHAFGRALLAFYGYGEPRNLTKACSMIYEEVMTKPKVATVMRYYTAICNIRQRLWQNASNQLETASFMQYAPAVELVSE